MTEGVVLNPTRLVIAALIGLVILLVLIIKFNIQAMIAILVGAICIGLIAGMPLLSDGQHYIENNCSFQSWAGIVEEWYGRKKMECA